MVSCAVAGCTNHVRRQKDLDFKFHRFPKNSEIILKWVNACKRPCSFTVENARVCSVHFDDSDYIRDLKNELLNLPIRRVLRPEAVPHLNLSPKNSGLVRQSSKNRGKRAQKRNNRKEPSPLSSNMEEMLIVKEEPDWLTVKEEPGLFQIIDFPSLKEEPCSEDENFTFVEIKTTCADDDAGTGEFKCEKDAEEADSQPSPLSSSVEEMLTVKEEPGLFQIIDSPSLDAKMDSDPSESTSTAVIEDQAERLRDTNIIPSPESENEEANLCPQCDERFTNRLHLSRHVRLAHTESGKFHCTYCDISFSKFSNFKRHLKIHKGMQRVFCCTICNSSFTRNEALKRHLMSHNGVKPYICPLCGNAFTRRANFVQHQTIHTGGKPFECKACNSSFRWKSELQKHLQRHTSTRHKDTFICLHCKKTYSSRRNLMRHIAVHSSELTDVVPSPEGHVADLSS